MKKKLVMSIMLIIATSICIAGCRNGASAPTSSVNRPTIVATPSEVVAKATPATTAATRAQEMATIPAPTSAREIATIPAPTSAREIATIPAPTSAREIATIPAPTRAQEVATIPAPTRAREMATIPAPTSAREIATIPAPTSAREIATIPAPTRAPYTPNKWGRVTTSTEAVTLTELFPIEKGVFVLILSEQDTEITIAWYGDTATIPRNSVHILENITPEYEEKILQSRTAGVISP